MAVKDRETIQQAPVQLPELPEDVEVPDDLSGLELHDRIDRRRTAVGIRWLRWVVPILLLAVGAVLLTGDFGDDTSVPWAANEGPGSHSLDGAVATLTYVHPVATETAGPFAASEGPGSHSLIAATPSVGSWAATRGPGSDSLVMPAVAPLAESVTVDYPQLMELETAPAVASASGGYPWPERLTAAVAADPTVDYPVLMEFEAAPAVTSTPSDYPFDTAG